MNVRTAVFCAALAVMAIAAPSGARADEPTSGFRGDLLWQINAVEREIVDLEAAVPQSKFTWRPAEGVRSISEVYSHIAFGNYIILKLAGYEPPADAHFVPDLKKWDAQTTDKEKIAEMLRRSFDHVKAVVGGAKDAELEKRVNVFGTDMTVRGAMLTLLSHLHEHLGQSIAYARSNAVVPPWTAAAAKAEADKKSSGDKK